MSHHSKTLTNFPSVLLRSPRCCDSRLRLLHSEQFAIYPFPPRTCFIFVIFNADILAPYD